MIRLVEEIGPVLTGREAGIEVRGRVEKCVSQGEAVVLDFEGVQAISPSFADEVFARITPAMIDGGQVRFENLGDDLLMIARLVTRQAEQRSRH